LTGDFESTTELYDQAIAAARDHDWPRDLALANERTAMFYQRRGRDRIARAYMTDAAYGFARWGARAHVHDLAQRFPDLVPVEAQIAIKADFANVADGEVDTLHFARSLQKIAQEVVLDNVVEQIMRLVLQRAGAERGVLLLERGGVLVVYARLIADAPPLELGLNLGLADCPDLPATIIRYVARLSESVVLDDASLDSRFASDPYVSREHPRSITCLPMSHQGRGVGVLYLENNEAAAVFTRQRIELLSVLSSQAVISIENAALVARVRAMTDKLSKSNHELEAQVRQRTAELSVANDRLMVELSERHDAEAERARVQAQRLAELSTPVIPFSRDILLIPLIGTLDAQRVGELLETAMTGAHERRAKVVILDVTGVKGADGAVAHALVSTSRSLRLLGADVIVTGIRPSMALTMIEQGDALRRLTIKGTLELGVAEALERTKR